MLSSVKERLAARGRDGVLADGVSALFDRTCLRMREPQKDKQCQHGRTK